MDIGESFVGQGADAAHVNTMIGPRSGPVGVAWASAIATPTSGHAPFMVVYQPGVPVHPPTLFVNKATIAGDPHGELTWGAAQAGVANKATIAGDRHGELTWGAAQAGVAKGVTAFVEHPRWADHPGDLPHITLGDGGWHALDDLVIICAVWVNPDAGDAQAVFDNNALATEQALEVGSGVRPRPVRDGSAPSNPYFPAR